MDIYSDAMASRYIPFRRSIAFRILIVSFILLALPLLVDAFIIVRASYLDAINDAKAHLTEAARLKEGEIYLLQPSPKVMLSYIEYFLGLPENMPEKPSKEMQERLQKIADAGEITNLFILKFLPDGHIEVIDSNNPLYLGKDFIPFFLVHNVSMEEIIARININYFTYDPYSYDPYFVSGRVILSKDDKPIGMLVASRNIKEQLPHILKPNNLLYPVHFALLSSNTLIFAAEDQDLMFNFFLPLDAKQREAILEQQAHFRKHVPTAPLKFKWIGHPYLEFTWKGQEQIGYFENVSYAQLLIFAYAEKKRIFIMPLFDFWEVFVVYLLILFIGGIVAYILTRRMARPMNHLTHVMEAIGGGDSSARYKSDPLGYEINELGSIFNGMIDTVLQKKALAEEERVKRETYARELLIGQQVQRSLLPERMPEYKNVLLAARYIPAKQVGGDFYDVLLKKKGGKEQLALAVADASGKGVQACFYSLGVRSMLRTFVREYDDVGEVLAKTNSLFTPDTGDTGMFVTVVMAIYDDETHRLDYFSCGHNPPLLCRKSGETVWLNHLGFALGISETMESSSRSIYLDSGDIVVFYTDGITEAHDVDYAQFSEERLLQFFQQHREADPNVLADGLMRELDTFVGEAAQHDDITLLIMKVL